MDLPSHVNGLLESVADHLGLSGGKGLSLDKNNECILALEPNLLVMFYLEERTGDMIVNLPVAPLPAGPEREEILMELLGANYCWARTEGATFGLDQGTGFLCLTYLVALPLDPVGQIKTILEKLLDVVAHWRKEIPALAEAWEGRAPAEAGGFPMLRV